MPSDKRRVFAGAGSRNTPEFGDVTVKSEEINGDKAIVTAVETSKDGKSNESKINLIKEDGDWKIDMSGMAGMGK